MANLGLHSRDTRINYLAAILWGILIVIGLNHLGELKTFFGAILTASFFFGLSHLRNTYLEAQLKAALESGLNYSTATFDEFHVMIRNATWVPVTIREIRLRKAPDKQKPGHLARMRYRGPSYCVVNNDPDEFAGDFLPHSSDLPWPVKAKMGILKGDEKYDVKFSPDPGDFHTLAPETGAIYALAFGACQQFMTDNIHECLIVVDYPTILGRTKTIIIRASAQSVRFVQHSLRDMVPMMQKQAKEMLEQATPLVNSPLQ